MNPVKSIRWIAAVLCLSVGWSTTGWAQAISGILIAALLLVSLATATWAQVPAAATVAAGVVNEDVYPEHNVSFPGGVTGIPDLIFYSPSTYRAVRMDLYLPPATFNSSRPFIVYTHGGGWSGGSKRTTGAFSNWPGVLAALAAKGYVVASLDYRLLGDEIAPAAIQDTKAAIRFLRANAAKYNVDRNRGLTWGPSAGGQLAALAAASCGVTALSPPPRAARGAGAGRRGGGAGQKEQPLKLPLPLLPAWMRNPIAFRLQSAGMEFTLHDDGWGRRRLSRLRADSALRA